ncbi:MAG: HU family DNA-binding protein [Bryobacteraceae bacterium]
MSKNNLTELLARRSHLNRAAAADQVHRLVHSIVRSLRKGQGAELPGLGTFRPGRPATFEFDEKSGPGRRK